MEMNYFSLYLKAHMADHGFEESEISSTKVLDNVLNAESIFEESRRNGYDVEGAKELAMAELFQGIGMSKRETMSEIILTNFQDKIHVDSPEILDFWVERLSESPYIVSLLSKDGGIGFDPNKLDENIVPVVDFINEYISNHYGV